MRAGPPHAVDQAVAEVTSLISNVHLEATEKRHADRMSGMTPAQMNEWIQSQGHHAYRRELELAKKLDQEQQEGIRNIEKTRRKARAEQRGKAEPSTAVEATNTTLSANSIPISTRTEPKNPKKAPKYPPQPTGPIKNPRFLRRFVVQAGFSGKEHSVDHPVSENLQTGQRSCDATDSRRQPIRRTRNSVEF